MAIDIKRWWAHGSTVHGHTTCHFLPCAPPQGHPDPTCRPRRKGCRRPQHAATGGGARLPLGDHAPPCHALCVAGLPLQTGLRRTRRQGPAYTTPVTILRVATLATCTPSGETAATKVGCPDTASALAGSWGDLWVEPAFDQPGGRGEKGHLTRAGPNPPPPARGPRWGRPPRTESVFPHLFGCLTATVARRSGLLGGQGGGRTRCSVTLRAVVDISIVNWAVVLDTASLPHLVGPTASHLPGRTRSNGLPLWRGSLRRNHNTTTTRIFAPQFSVFLGASLDTPAGRATTFSSILGAASGPRIWQRRVHWEWTTRARVCVHDARQAGQSRLPPQPPVLG